MIRYLSTGSADLARLLAQSHAPNPSPAWVEAMLFFGFEAPEKSEPALSIGEMLWTAPAE